MQLFLKISIIKQKYSVNIIPLVLKHYNYRTYFCCEISFPDPWFDESQRFEKARTVTLVRKEDFQPFTRFGRNMCNFSNIRKAKKNLNSNPTVLCWEGKSLPLIKNYSNSYRKRQFCESD